MLLLRLPGIGRNLLLRFVRASLKGLLHLWLLLSEGLLSRPCLRHLQVLQTALQALLGLSRLCGRPLAEEWVP